MKPWYILPLSLGLATSAHAGNGFAQWGVQLSVTPGQKMPLGLGLEGGVGHIGEGDVALREEAFATLEMRGFSHLRTVFGARIGVGTTRHGHIDTMPELGVGLALRSIREGAAGLHIDAGLRQRIAADNGTLLMRADYTFSRQTDGAPPWAMTAGFGVNRGSYDWFGRGGDYTMVVDGRPIRRAGEAQLPQAMLRRSTPTARSWLERARTEHASAPAFLQLAEELRALGAPRRLVGRALRAADEERHHALLCYAMACREGGQVAIRSVPGWRVRPGDRRRRLSRLAHEALYDGIIGEGEAAERALARRDAERSELAARVEHSIVVEESSHARLSADVLRWAVQEGGQAPALA